MRYIDDLHRECIEILEPNLQFHRQGPGDPNRYSVGPEVLQALAWVATSIALPILLGGASEVVKDRVKDWLENRKKRRDAVPAQSETGHGNPDPLLEVGVSDQHKQQAIHAVAELLEHRGWPRAFARANATEIVAAIEETLRRKR